MNTNGLCLLGALVCAGFAASCAGEDPRSESGSAEQVPAISWQEFLEYSRKDSRIVNGERIYIVEWDIPLREQQLYEYYLEHFVETDKSTVDVLASGADDVWTNYTQLNLTYCVSTNFGSSYARMVGEVEQATLAWARVANVRFLYTPSADSNCTDANAAVEIPVRSLSFGGACSFFPVLGAYPNCTTQGRALVVDVPAIDAWPSQQIYGAVYPNLTTFGVLQHELGHTLGLRHEHIREADNAVANCVNEVNNPGPYRALTDYDNNSSMHYPWCDGVQTSTQNVTARDGEGLRMLYGPPAAWIVI